MTFAKKLTSFAAAHLMIFMLAGNAFALTDDHVVKASELHQCLLQASKARQANLEKAEGFFTTGRAKQAMQYSGVSPSKVVNALALLGDGELAQLAARVDKVNKDFAAGALSNQQLTYIVIALATAVIILVIVEA